GSPVSPAGWRRAPASWRAASAGPDSWKTCAGLRRAAAAAAGGATAGAMATRSRSLSDLSLFAHDRLGGRGQGMMRVGGAIGAKLPGPLRHLVEIDDRVAQASQSGRIAPDTPAKAP